MLHRFCASGNTNDQDYVKGSGDKKGKDVGGKQLKERVPAA